jgi:hypothetical protein
VERVDRRARVEKARPGEVEAAGPGDDAVGGDVEHQREVWAGAGLVPGEGMVEEGFGTAMIAAVAQAASDSALRASAKADAR